MCKTFFEIGRIPKLPDPLPQTIEGQAALLKEIIECHELGEGAEIAHFFGHDQYWVPDVFRAEPQRNKFFDDGYAARIIISGTCRDCEITLKAVCDIFGMQSRALASLLFIERQYEHGRSEKIWVSIPLLHTCATEGLKAAWIRRING